MLFRDSRDYTLDHTFNIVSESAMNEYRVTFGLLTSLKRNQIYDK